MQSSCLPHRCSKKKQKAYMAFLVSRIKKKSNQSILKRIKMLKRKKLWSLIAAALLVTACGGGGGGSDDDSGNGTPPPVAGGGSNTGDNNNGDNNNPPDNQVVDQQLQGNVLISANQFVYVNPNRKFEYGNPESLYNAGQIEQLSNGWFNDDGTFGGYISIAPGGTAEDYTNPAVEVKPVAAAPTTPIASFGFRVSNEVYNGTAITSGIRTNAAQTAVGRVAFDFAEDPATVPSGQKAAQRMSFVIDKVEFSIDASGKLAAQVLDGGRIYVDGINADGERVQDSLAAPRDSVKIMPLIPHVHDHYNDESSSVIQFELERAFAQAGPQFEPLQNLKGLFDMKIRISSIKLIRPESSVASLPEVDLTEDPIQVAGQPAVGGAGVNAKIHVRRGY